MKVCMLIERFYPVYGGAENQAMALCERLIAKGVDLFVLTRRIDRSLPGYEKIGNVLVYRLSPGGVAGENFLFDLLYMFSVTFSLIKHCNDIDIVHSHGSGLLESSGIFFAKLLKKKTIVLIPTAKELAKRNPDVKGGILEAALRRIFSIQRIKQFFLKRSDAFISLSSEISGELIEAGISRERIKSIPNGVLMDKFYPATFEEKQALRKKNNIPSDKVVFSVVGRIVRRKRIDMLLKAWKDVVGKRENLLLLVIGSGKNQVDSNEAEVRRFAEQNDLGPSVRFLGDAYNVDEYLKLSDVFVFPSQREGLPNAVLEAMACGLPVIASLIGGNVDIIENGKDGILFKVDNAEELTNAIRMLVDDKGERKELGEQARIKIEKKYSMDKVVQNYAELYQQLLIKGGVKK